MIKGVVNPDLVLQQDNQQVYQLLCRLGCYRYQDVRRVPIEGVLALLWDVPEPRRKRVVKALEYRSLVKVCNNEYYLHSVIRAEAIARLRESEDWEIANCKAAEFWTESVKTVEKTEDALRALESCHHYLYARNIDLACRVILKSTNSQWGDYETLGRSYYRLGLFNKMISIIGILQKEDNSTDNSYWSELYNVWGSMYWLKGDLNKALEYYKLGYELAIDFNIKHNELTSLLNIVLCKLDLGNLKDARDHFYEYNKKATEYKSIGHIEISWFCLALLNSMMGFKQEAHKFAKKSYNVTPQKNQTSPWGIGYRLLFLGSTYKNLKDFDKSFEMYHSGISFAEESHYTQVKAKALTGLAELYREQGDFETALSHHSESIELLERITAKCDLAEAYYQLGLTYQKMSEAEKSQENFDKAIPLYTKIQAPKQIEKVQRTMKKLAPTD